MKHVLYLLSLIVLALPLHAQPPDYDHTFEFEMKKGKYKVPAEYCLSIGNASNSKTSVYTEGQPSKSLEMHCRKGARAKAMAKGTVAGIAKIEKHKIVILRHGKYLSIYYYLDNVKVRKGQRVNEGDILGNITLDEGMTTLYLELWKEKEVLKPEPWFSLDSILLVPPDPIYINTEPDTIFRNDSGLVVITGLLAELHPDTTFMEMNFQYDFIIRDMDSITRAYYRFQNALKQDAPVTFTFANTTGTTSTLSFPLIEDHDVHISDVPFKVKHSSRVSIPPNKMKVLAENKLLSITLPHYKKFRCFNVKNQDMFRDFYKSIQEK